MIDLMQSWRRQRSISKTRRALDGLSDHILADIGLERSDIAGVSRSGTTPRRSGF